MINIRALLDSSNFSGFLDRIREELQDARDNLEVEKDADERLRLQGDIRAFKKVLALPEIIRDEQDMDSAYGGEVDE